MPLTDNVALVSLTREISTRDLMRVAAAVQKQVTRDFTPAWGLRATVDAFEELRDVPSDYHPVLLFGDPDELMGRLEFLVGDVKAARLVEQFEGNRLGGIHLNAFTRQPFALVPVSDDWSVTVSHETLEMIADPFGNRLIAAAHPTNPEAERVKYLLEVCDPCQAIWYPVNGEKMADFYTPRYFDPVRNPAALYSFTGALRRPLDLVEGGYLTWIDPGDSGLYQLRSGDDEPVLLADIVSLARTSAPLRTVVDTNASSPRATPESLMVADSATAKAGSEGAVRDASSAAAVSSAEAILSLTAEAELWD
jgi:hypothetical protein